MPDGADENGIRAYYDLGVPVPRPGGIAGGIANGEVGGIGGGVADGLGGVAGGLADGGVNSIGGDIARPDGLDFSVEYPPDESGVNDGFAADNNVPVTGAAGIGGDVANSDAAAGSGEFFPPDVTMQSQQTTSGAGMFNGRTSAGFRGLDANANNGSPATSPANPGGSRFRSGGVGGTVPSARPNGRNQRGSATLNERFGDNF